MLVYHPPPQADDPWEQPPPGAAPTPHQQGPPGAATPQEQASPREMSAAADSMHPTGLPSSFHSKALFTLTESDTDYMCTMPQYVAVVYWLFVLFLYYKIPFHT